VITYSKKDSIVPMRSVNCLANYIPLNGIYAPLEKPHKKLLTRTIEKKAPILYGYRPLPIW